MAAYRLMSTRHHGDGSVGTPWRIDLSADDDHDADAQARRYPLDEFIEPIDFAWLLDEAGAVVCSFPVQAQHAP